MTAVLTQIESAPRSVLQAQVTASARCASGVDPNLFFRADTRSDPTWPFRRAEALQTCAACPVMEACRELALRNGDGTDADDMVRGGLTGRQLTQTRKAQAARLTDINTAEVDTEWTELFDLLRTRADLIHNSLTRGRPGAARRERTAQVKELEDRQIQAATSRISEIRADRRARTGWSAAA